MAIDPRLTEIGDRFPDTKWVVRGKLGEGGMGVVLDVVKPPGIVGAMKVMLPGLAERREYIDAFLNEVRIQVSLRHEHIVQIIDFEELADGTLYFVMERIEGSTLRQTMRSFGHPIPPPHVHEITCQISEALDRAHSQGVVHRDLKLENVFLHSPEGSGKVTVKVGDFGIAVLAHGKRVRGIFGTPKYMSPEQFRGERVTSKTDIYSLGLMIYEMLTGRLPWELPEDVAAMREIALNAAPIPPKRFAPWLPDSVNNVILGCLAKRPEDRPRDAVEVANRLYELQFCAGTSALLDEQNTTEPSLCTLATLVGSAEREEMTRSGRSVGTGTAQGMTPPPMEGRSLEVAPAGMATAPLPASVMAPRVAEEVTTTPTKPVTGAAWPESFAAPPIASDAPASRSQQTGEGVASSIGAAFRDHDEPVVTISRRTMRRVLLVVPVAAVLLVGAVVAPLALRHGAAGEAPSATGSGPSMAVGGAVSAPPPPLAPPRPAAADGPASHATLPAASSSAAKTPPVVVAPGTVRSMPPSPAPVPPPTALPVTTTPQPAPWTRPPPPAAPTNKPAADDGHELLQ